MDNTPTPSPRIVGWMLQPTSKRPRCERCGLPAAVIVDRFGDYNTTELCSDCVPSGAADPIAEAFERAIEARQAKRR